jgi:hypothetical protein
VTLFQLVLVYCCECVWIGISRAFPHSVSL